MMECDSCFIEPIWDADADYICADQMRLLPPLAAHSVSSQAAARMAVTTRNQSISSYQIPL